MKQWAKTTGIAATTFVIGGVIGVAGISHLALEEPRPSPYSETRTPDPNARISGEAREGCQLLGMAYEEIALEPDVCLRLYWAPDRLTRSAGLYDAWLAHNGISTECAPDGLCDLSATDEPPLPPDEDPWWVEQALADPARTTLGGTANSMRPDGRHDPQG